ncbi:DUF2793 domain-containing protein [Tropicibacter sp. R16_0]|uniref:DUF2793 domain-containing protein n=1 Tax=Tropicibacter sp. R16_0 TaxID=2821102 RepID=UPI001ADA5699|nr:DUF2793 domain-containing protein [Tropicibacter sp. R16_0]MBO9453334.1 DUF2793 domain-containing protein [Tropicibacter sp. R16_0]
MANISPRLDLPYIQPAQAQKHVTHNEALQRLDILTQLVVLEVDAQTPPAAPETGETHALGSAPTGAWAGQAGRLAYWNGSAWIFVAPQQGWRAFDRSSGRAFVHDGTDWKSELSDLNNLDEVGIGSSADATNRLAVASTASLFSHAGAGHQVKINKATAGDTASVLFQSNWTGHAEMGLAGDTAFAIKTSADGTTWSDTLRLDPATQQIEAAPDGTTRFRLSATSLDLDVPITGSAVQSSPMDTTPGRVLGMAAFGLGATDHPDTRQNTGNSPLPSGFYSGNGGSASAATFPHSGCRYTPFLTLNRRISTGSYGIRRVFFNNNIPIVWGSSDSGATWNVPNTLYGTDNLVGIVSESGGTPTGAVIEQGENASGQYIRWADGTQFCTNGDAAITTPAAAFTGTITKIDGDKLWIGRWF